jgi:hypothetical protein
MKVTDALPIQPVEIPMQEASYEVVFYSLLKF